MANVLNEAVMDTDWLSRENSVYSQDFVEELNGAFENCQVGKVVCIVMWSPPPIYCKKHSSSPNRNTPITCPFLLFLRALVRA